MTYNARTGTMEFVHTPEWGGLDPAQHLAYVFGLIEGLSQKFGELDVDFIRENITVADIIHKTPAKGVKVPENGLRDRTYGYEELTTRGLEAQEDYAQLGKLQRSLGPSAEPTAGRGASGSAVVPERPERKGPWAKRRTAAVKNGYSPLEFPGFDANAKRTFKVEQQIKDKDSGDVKVVQINKKFKVGRNKWLQNPARNDRARIYRRFEEQNIDNKALSVKDLKNFAAERPQKSDSRLARSEDC